MKGLKVSAHFSLLILASILWFTVSYAAPTPLNIDLRITIGSKLKKELEAQPRWRKTINHVLEIGKWTSL
ncbi:hypothetical protein CVT24_009287 [Panaeolus cyanescens]|uniref:Uncharacterized protein n=1 Tax=Panaeolus cyanescens TaxID=181874 RepID=A0A409Y8F1_9AGAR|nr:hypothetical protein CVT24_009287 [Panaeolus cyanescens]